MPAKQEKESNDPSVQLLRGLLIAELAKAGVTQAAIREIVGCDMRRVSEIARFFKKKKTKATPGVISAPRV